MPAHLFLSVCVMADYFYIPSTPEEHLQLSETEAKHLVKVLRYKEGDFVYFTDGKGTRYTGVLESIDYYNCFARIVKREVDFGKRNYRLHLGIAPTKNIERFEWLLEKATEIGVDEITPMICHRSERRELRSDRLGKILVAAMKQSGQCLLPKLNEASQFSELIKQSADQRFICHLDREPVGLGRACKPGGSVLLLVGPEGDFSEEELKLATEHSLTCVALGATRLRTETAGVVGCSIIAQVNRLD